MSAYFEARGPFLLLRYLGRERSIVVDPSEKFDLSDDVLRYTKGTLFRFSFLWFDLSSNKILSEALLVFDRSILGKGFPVSKKAGFNRH